MKAHPIQRLASLALATVITAATLGGLDGLASRIEVSAIWAAASMAPRA